MLSEILVIYHHLWCDFISRSTPWMDRAIMDRCVDSYMNQKEWIFNGHIG
ncbi:hypothetical protein [Vibrio fluminensis]|nr:hypothetical protein [Vibrio fluminensis]